MGQRKINLNFTMDDLLDLPGIEGYNDALDGVLEDSEDYCIPTDISYRLVSLTDGLLVIEATFTPDDGDEDLDDDWDLA